MRRFRIRPFRPVRRAARLASWLGRPLLRRLRQAHRWRQTGRFAEAASGFAELEQAAWDLAPDKAALLAVEAGLSFLLSGETETGREHLDSGLNWLERNAGAQRAGSVRARAAAELRAAGLPQEAARIQAESSAPSPPTSRAAPRLPSKCPQCGGGLLPAEAEWADETSVVCGYCGSRVAAEA